MNFLAVGDKTDSGPALLPAHRLSGQVLQYTFDVLTEEVDQAGLDVVVRHVQDENIGRRFWEDVVPAIIFGPDEFVRAEAELRPLVLVHSHSGVVQMLEIFRRHLAGRLAKRTLESAAAVDELHKRAHVGLAAAAADRTQLAHVHHGRRLLSFLQLGKRADHQAERHGRLLHHIG